MTDTVTLFGHCILVGCLLLVSSPTLGRTEQYAARGDTGPTGYTGRRGATGWTGKTGATGRWGRRGDTGGTGMTGPEGRSGATGVRGGRGLTGATGLHGATGRRGPAGGPPGPIGATGPIGPAGGPRGQTGSTGPVGRQGRAGDVGATGPRGPAGGPPGAVGATGPKGRDGATGAQRSIGTNIGISFGTQIVGFLIVALAIYVYRHCTCNRKSSPKSLDDDPVPLSAVVSGTHHQRPSANSPEYVNVDTEHTLSQYESIDPTTQDTYTNVYTTPAPAAVSS